MSVASSAAPVNIRKYRISGKSGVFSFGYFSLDKHDCMDAGGRATQEAKAERKVTRWQSETALSDESIKHNHTNAEQHTKPKPIKINSPSGEACTEDTRQLNRNRTKHHTAKCLPIKSSLKSVISPLATIRPFSINLNSLPTRRAKLSFCSTSNTVIFSVSLR